MSGDKSPVIKINGHVQVSYVCQFCHRSIPVKRWLNKGMTCPECGKNYSYQLAQDSEE